MSSKNPKAPSGPSGPMYSGSSGYQFDVHDQPIRITHSPYRQKLIIEVGDVTMVEVVNVNGCSFARMQDTGSRGRFSARPLFNNRGRVAKEPVKQCSALHAATGFQCELRAGHDAKEHHKYKTERQDYTWKDRHSPIKLVKIAARAGDNPFRKPKKRRWVMTRKGLKICQLTDVGGNQCELPKGHVGMHFTPESSYFRTGYPRRGR